MHGREVPICIHEVCKDIVKRPLEDDQVDIVHEPLIVMFQWLIRFKKSVNSLWNFVYPVEVGAVVGRVASLLTA